MTLYHAECRNYVYLDVSKCFIAKATGVVDVKNQKIKAIEINLSRKKETSIDPDLYCERCGKVETNQVISFCQRCENSHNLDELFIPQDSGGMYCKDCAARFKEVLVSVGEFYKEKEIEI